MPENAAFRYTSREKNGLATQDQAAVTLRLEFSRRPDWMAQFPFAHSIEITYRLRGTTLEVDTALENHSAEPMPVAIGYHPYFQLTAAPRDNWNVHLAAREHMVLSPKLVPTGETKPVAFADPQPLAGVQLDDVFTGLVRNLEGLAEFSVSTGSQKLTVAYGPKYPVAVVYAPPGRGFICFEPMAAPTNAFNMAAEGKWKGLQSVAPGARWRESYWIRAEGF
ncbi:MAG: aldose 1-epimerase [Acidobacteria bacterium]|nr:aldose 1-epimerase [Acidobacteriota bacterium]